MGKSSLVYAIPLSFFNIKAAAAGKKRCEPFLVEGSKGCHLFSVDAAAAGAGAVGAASAAGGRPASKNPVRCRLALAVQKRIRAYELVPRNPANVPGMGTGLEFVLARELKVADYAASLVTT